MRLKQNAGNYALSFFNIWLNDMDAFSEDGCRKSATFVHEFLHYLQDLNLPYNIRLNMSQWRRFGELRNAVRKINDDGKGSVTVHLPFDKWSEETQMVINQQDSTLGSSKMIHDVTSLPEIESTSDHVNGVYDLRLQKLRKFDVYQYTATIKGEPYQLGAGQLLEYIAWKIETKHCPSGVEVPSLPYRAVDMLFEKYNLGLLPDCIRINYVELSLYNDNPMRFLIHSILEPNQDMKFLPSIDYQELYKDCYQRNLSTIFCTTDGICETLAQKRNRRWTDLVELLDGQFRQFPNIRAWITKVNQYALNHWQDHFLFSDLYTMNTSQFQKEIWNLVEELGVPLIFDSRKEPFSVGAVTDCSEFLQFYILQEYLDYLTEGSPNVLELRSSNECSAVVCPLLLQEIKCGTLDENGNVLVRDGEDEGTAHCYDSDDFVSSFKSTVDCPYKRFLEQHGLSKLKVIEKI